MSSDIYNASLIPATHHASTFTTSLASLLGVSSDDSSSFISGSPSIVEPTTSNLSSNSSSSLVSIPIHSHAITSNATASTVDPSSTRSTDLRSSSYSSFHSHPTVISQSSVYNESSSIPFVASSLISYSSSSDSNHLLTTSSSSTIAASSSSTSINNDPITYTVTAEVTTAVTSYVSTGYPEETTVFFTQPFYITDSSKTITTSLPYSTVIPNDESFQTDSLQAITTDFAYLASVVPGYKSSRSTSANGDSNSNSKTIAGSVVGSVMGVAMIFLILWYLLYKRRKKNSSNFEKGFSHSIESTRRYDGENVSPHYSEKNSSGTSPSRFSSLIPFTRASTSSESSNGSNGSNSSNGSNDSSGLGSLRSSILKDQQIPNERTPITSQHPFKRIIPKSYNKRRMIDTVFEESSDSSTQSSPTRESQPQSSSTLYNSNRSKPISQRYQNSGLKPMNPFETSKSIPPPPPPSRRSNAYPASNDFHRHENNRSSVTSVESSIVSEDTDDISTDESLIQFGEDGLPTNTGSSKGFFKEVV